MSLAFHSQVFFLTHRLRSHFNLAQHPNVVQMRVYEDAEILPQLYQQGILQIVIIKPTVICMKLPCNSAPPDLVIYLRASVDTLMNRINSRGRDYERKITPEYLQNLNHLYEAWIENFTLCPVLAVPADDLDYVAHSGHLRLIISKIDDKLTGKEEVVFDADEVARATED